MARAAGINRRRNAAPGETPTAHRANVVLLTNRSMPSGSASEVLPRKNPVKGYSGPQTIERQGNGGSAASVPLPAGSRSSVCISRQGGGASSMLNSFTTATTAGTGWVHPCVAGPSATAAKQLAEPQASVWLLVKRVVEGVAAAVALLLLAPLFLLIMFAIKLDSPGPVFFRVRRVGYLGRDLPMLKFRKMHDHARGGPLTAREDSRLTRVGRVLACCRLDELPQLWHVLRGEMSLVGPRPEDPRFVSMHPEDYEVILTVRPGITGLSQIAYKEEASIVDDDRPVEDYVSRIMPQKLVMDRLYATKSGLWLDLSIARWTLVTMLLRKPVSVNRQTAQMNVRRRPSPVTSGAPALSVAGATGATLTLVPTGGAPAPAVGAVVSASLAAGGVASFPDAVS